MVQIRSNISLKPFHTFGIDVRARKFSSFSNVDELNELITEESSDKILILGGGSNILFTKDFDGLVLKNEVLGIEVVNEDEDYVYLKAGAGENWHQLVMHCLQNGYAGIENLSLIPGNVGASPMQNIGAYGVEIKDVFHELEGFHLKEKVIQKFTNKDCEFGYRESIFKKSLKNQFVITSVTYKLNKNPTFNTSYGAIEQELERMGVSELSIAAISQAVINIRSSKLPDPKIIGNAGSFFKNPKVDKAHFENLKNTFSAIPSFPFDDAHVKVPAGWLIEHSGPNENISWKGFRKGDAGCSSKQALVLVNYETATGSEIFDLSDAIKKSVEEKFKIQLEREVNIF